VFSTPCGVWAATYLGNLPPVDDNFDPRPDDGLRQIDRMGNPAATLRSFPRHLRTPLISASREPTRAISASRSLTRLLRLTRNFARYIPRTAKIRIRISRSWRRWQFRTSCVLRPNKPMDIRTDGNSLTGRPTS
jgi:hypothetical protein